MAFNEDQLSAAGWSVTITGPRFVVMSNDDTGFEALYDKRDKTLWDHDDGLSLDPDDIHLYTILRILADIVPDDHARKPELTDLIERFDVARTEITEL